MNCESFHLTYTRDNGREAMSPNNHCMEQTMFKEWLRSEFRQL
ncbi:hypothetical protein [Paenibacillus massiliensis]|nr:hypothetical protein [Paenibacillus massiliensis]